MGNIITGVVLFLVIGGALAYVIKTRKQGGCSGCSGNCSCNHPKEAKKQQ